MRLQLTDGTAITFVGGRPTLFSERRQKLFATNEVEAYIGCRLEDRIAIDELIDELLERGLTAEDARAATARLLPMWSRLGIAAASYAPPAAEPSYVQKLSIAGHGVRLRYHDCDLAETIAPVFAHLQATAAEVCTTYDLWRTSEFVLVSRNTEPAAILTAEEAAPAVKGYLTEDILQDSRLALHTATLVRNDKAMLLTGPPGAGKTTLTLHLAKSGFLYGGDDIALFNRDGTVRPVPFAAAVKPGAWSLVSQIEPNLGLMPIHRRQDGKRVRYLRPARLAGARNIPIGWIVVLRRQRGRGTHIVDLDPVDTLRHLLSGASSTTRTLSLEVMRALVPAVSAAACFELHYSNPEAAVATLIHKCDDEAP